MDIKAHNNNEWRNPDNWSRPGLFGIYFSKKDTRVWVPKSLPVLGWTINFGHRNAVFWMGALLLIPALVVVAIALIMPGS